MDTAGISNVKKGKGEGPPVVESKKFSQVLPVWIYHPVWGSKIVRTEGEFASHASDGWGTSAVLLTQADELRKTIATLEELLEEYRGKLLELESNDKLVRMAKEIADRNKEKEAETVETGEPATTTTTTDPVTVTPGEQVVIPGEVQPPSGSKIANLRGRPKNKKG